ncbi:MAG: OsmC family protein [Acidobacteriia bacterium]|nr:OsmC family protein [Terriglobia bacterium]
MRTEVLVDHLGEVQFEVKARSHSIICDQPMENGGFDEGMTPAEFLLASLGTCAGYYAVQYMKAWKLPMEGLRIRTTADKAKAPARLTDFRIELEFLTELDQRHRDGIVRAVHACLIHNTLLNPPRIDVEVTTSAVPIAA